MAIRVVEVNCKCSRKLFKYQKVGAGRLVKCYLPRILTDYVKLPAAVKTGMEVRCPACGGRIGVIHMIKRVPAVKLNQGQIKPLRLG